MTATTFDVRFIPRTVSFPEDMLAAVRLVAAEDRHGNFSRVIQEAVEEKLERRYGRNWPERVAEAVRGDGAITE